MKNTLKSFLVIFLTIFSLNYSYWYDYTTNDNLIINKYSGQVLKIIDNWWDKTDFDQSIDKYLSLHNDNIQVVNVLNKVKSHVASNIEQKEQEKQEVEISSNSTNWYKSKINFSDHKVDIEKVREVWLWYYNSYRKSLWLANYSYDWILNDTAQEWSDLAMNRWYIDHKRSSWDAYYNYNKINYRFKERWVICKNISRITFSENIWRWDYRCSDDDCSEELASATKSVFNFYMSEKSYLWAHYQSIVNKHFSKIWVWISIKKVSTNSFKFYITTHFCTELL